MLVLLYTPILLMAGAWAWVAASPWSHLAAGNPPSAIAAGHTLIDGSVAPMAGLVASACQLRRHAEGMAFAADRA